MTVAEFEAIQNIVPIATAQISISTITTSILCPLGVILMDKYQRSKGIDGTKEFIVADSKKNKVAYPEAMKNEL